MNRPFLKTSTVAIVSLVLFYYSVAWAVLRCPHQENHSDYELAFSNISSYTAEASLPLSSHNQTNLDCPGLNYHTEFLAGPAAGSELIRLTRDIPSHANISLALSGVERDRAEYISLKAVFDKSSSPNFLIDLPRYLSLSVFRF